MRFSTLCTLLLCLPLFLRTVALSDDRELLRANGNEPWVFVVLDSSLAMAADTVGQTLPAFADDPRSRLFQAKQALYDVFKETSGIRYGFAMADQSNLRVRSKHYLYSHAPYSHSSEPFTFGRVNQNAVGVCPAPVASTRSIAKLGVWGDEVTSIWQTVNGETYLVVFSMARYRAGTEVPFPLLNNLGEREIFVEKAVYGPVTGEDCHALESILINGIDPFDGRVLMGEPALEYPYVYLSTKQRSRETLRLVRERAFIHTDEIDGGDVCGGEIQSAPFSPVDDQAQRFLSWLNPAHGEPVPPSEHNAFGVADYYEDLPGIDGYLRLRPDFGPPILAAGESNLPAMIHDFRESMESVMAACRQPYLIVVTHKNLGGCATEKVSDVAGLYRATGTCGENGVDTYIVDLGETDWPPLDGVGDGGLIRHANMQQLHEAFNVALGEILSEARSFSAVVSGRSETGEAHEKVYLAQFHPRPGQPYWEGHVLAFEAPIPFTEDPTTGRKVPDRSRALWDAHDKLLLQAPDRGTIPTDPNDPRTDDPATYRLHPYREDYRRVFYAGPATLELGATSPMVPRERLTWGPPMTTSGTALHGQEKERRLQDQRKALGLAENAALKPLWKAFHEEKVHDGQPFILGDTFHAAPLVVEPPANVLYATHPGSFPLYDEFRQQHESRDPTVLVAANDVQLHAFDGESGMESYSYIPRLLMPLLKERREHAWSLDGTPVGSDVFIDPEHRGLGSSDPPKASEREWRTIVVGGFRRGGAGYYALDVTEDEPRILWEFTDSRLGESWSEPDVGAIRLQDAWGNVTSRFVAIFGGGRDPRGLTSTDSKADDLYMVDIETGQPIYQRFLDTSSAAAAPAAVDTDGDGFLDRVYIGTTGSETTSGQLFRVDIGRPVELVDSCFCIVDREWEPYPIFDTGTEGSQRRIFFEPAVVYVPELGLYGVGFGTGNRENLWAPAPADGNRIYFFVDDTDDPRVIFDAPLNEKKLTDVTDRRVSPKLLTNAPPGERGWFIRLGADGTQPANEKVIGRMTALMGLSVVPAFVPTTDIVDRSGQPADCDAADGAGEFRCARRGVSRSYIQWTTHGAPAICNENGCQRRSGEVDDLISEPFFRTATGSSDEDSRNGDDDNSDNGHDDDNGDGDDGNGGDSGSTARCPPGLAEQLKTLIFPPTCAFSNFYWRLEASRTDTGMECLVEIPVCVVENNWQER